MPRVADHGQQRARLTGAARRVLARDGLAGLSMRSIAAEAGCTTGLVTHYFGSRRELVIAAMRATSDEQGARMRARLAAAPGDAAGVLAEVLPLDEERAGETRVWLGFYAQAVGDEQLLAIHEEAYAEWRQAIAEHFEILIGTGGEPVAEVADRVVVALNGLAIQAVLDRRHWTTERQRWFLDGIVADAMARLGPASAAGS